MNNDNVTYGTKDLHFAAYLYIKKVPLIRLERRTSEYKDRNPVYFIFDDQKQCEELDRLFWGEGDLINIRDYIGTIRDLRARAASVNYTQQQEPQNDQEK